MGRRNICIQIICISLSLFLLSACIQDSNNLQQSGQSDLSENRGARNLGNPADISLQDLNKWLGNKAVLSGDISFSPGEQQLTPEGVEILESLVPELMSSSGPISVVGFADGVGGDSELNDALSLGRAQVVASWLANRDYSLASRVTAPVGYGARGEVFGRSAVEDVPDPLRRVVVISVD